MTDSYLKKKSNSIEEIYYDLFDDFRGTVQIDDSLVNAHLIAIPGLGALTARRLSGGDA